MKIKHRLISSTILLALTPFVMADHPETVNLPGLSVEGVAGEGTPYRLRPENRASSDTGDLVRDLPGAELNRNGPLTGHVQYRGMYADRVNVLVDGMKMHQAGPNSMDSPLSYIPASDVEELTLHRGIAPVSSGVETIGGTVEATSKATEFSTGEAFEFHGEANAGFSHNNRSFQTGIRSALVNDSQRLELKALRDKGDDSRFRSGEIIPTEYERDQLSLNYALRNDTTEASFTIKHHDTGDSGTPALPMDILFARGEHYNADIQHQLTSGGELIAKLYYQDTDHRMNNFSLRGSPADPMMFRQTDADVEAAGLSLHYEINEWTLGLDADNATHNATINNPNNTGFRVTNFNDVERDRYSIFAEWDGALNNDWSMQSGIRYSHIRMDAGAVSADGLMGPMAATMGANAQRFNQQNRAQNDNLLDLAATFKRRLSSDLDLHLGLAQKERAASYQERYLWFPAEATAGLADGNTYLGDVGLDPETAWQLEAGLDWHQPAFAVSPRLFYHRVDDYIQGVTTAMPDTLRFTNVDAELYGLDTNWFAAISDHWQLEGTISYTRGKRRDTGDNLYRIAPLSARTTLSYRQRDWHIGVVAETVAAQDDIAEVNREQKTSGYAVFHLQGSKTLDNNLQLDAGVRNLFDREYTTHLGGYNRVKNNPDIAEMARLPELGRSVYLNLSYQW